MSRPCLFLDRDGVINVKPPNGGYVCSWPEFHLIPAAVDWIRLFNAAGFLVIVVTNQPGLALGMFDRMALRRVETALASAMSSAGVPLCGFYYCPHAPGSSRVVTGCMCRKPAPGLLRQAAHNHRLDLAQSWMIGDILDDVEAGHRAGCRSILIVNGGETEWDLSTALRQPDDVAADLLEAQIAITEYSQVRSERTPEPCL